MAILDTVPGLEVAVQVAGIPVPEYSDSSITVAVDGRTEEGLERRQTRSASLQAKSTTKFIEGTPGTEWTVRIRQTAGFKCNDGDRISCELSFDGMRTGLVHSKTINDTSEWEFEWNHLYVQNHVGEFETRQLVCIYDPCNPAAAKDDVLVPTERNKKWRGRDLSEIGTLIVKVYEFKNAERYGLGVLWNGQPSTKGFGVWADEQPSTAIFHTIAVNLKMPMDIPPAGKQPLATFEFRYRTRDILIEQGFIPAPAL
ncbi:hypothetical protein QBC44DRAFT_373490 [Cladorrhinum sp. PSN332]|nr:hypothetical protein QBC44DRAFT_373490 [Cladorrhinum sp. PSN332]